MNKWIGTDESGKGDYFGGISVAGVIVSIPIIKKLEELGVKDSKNLSDGKIKELNREIRKLCPFSIVSIKPQKYNELHFKMGNVNRILAWAHSRVIENLLEKEQCEGVVCDKFADDWYIKNALMKKGKNMPIIQRIKGEEDFAVAAASILARYEFLYHLDKLSEEIGVILPRGASNQVIEVGKKLVKEKGITILNSIAKTHFRLTHIIKKNG